MKKNTSDHHAGVSGLLEHIEILKDNILSIKAPSDFNIRTKADAEQTISEIRKLQEKVIRYQKTAKVLRESLEKEFYPHYSLPEIVEIDNKFDNL